MNPNSIFDNEETAKTYEESYQNEFKKADRLEKQLITKLLAEFPDAKTVLEVGCGTAHFTKWLQTLGYQCVGLDYSSAMLSEAKKQWSSGDLIRGDGARLPLANKSVDLTVFITSLEFITAAELAISEAARVSRDGLILGLLNKNSWAVLKRRLMGKSKVFSSAKFYSPVDMRRILSQAIGEDYEVASWSTTVFPDLFGDLESSVLPFGDFIGAAVKLEM